MASDDLLELLYRVRHKTGDSDTLALCDAVEALVTRPTRDRREYMRVYMARRRGEQRVQNDR